MIFLSTSSVSLQNKVHCIRLACFIAPEIDREASEAKLIASRWKKQLRCCLLIWVNFFGPPVSLLLVLIFDMHLCLIIPRENTAAERSAKQHRKLCLSTGCKLAKAFWQTMLHPPGFRSHTEVIAGFSSGFTIRLSWRSINHKSLARSFTRDWWISSGFFSFRCLCSLESHSFIGLSSPTRENQPWGEVWTDVSRKCKYQATLKSVFTAKFNYIIPPSVSCCFSKATHSINVYLWRAEITTVKPAFWFKRELFECRRVRFMSL